MIKTKTVKLCNILCAILMLALVICQFMPFWSANSDSASLQSYIWYPADHTGLTSYFTEVVGPTYEVMDVVIPTLLMMILGVLGFIFCIIHSKKCGYSLLSLACGISGLCGYLANPLYQLGVGWQLHLVLAIVITLLSIPGLIACVQAVIRWFKEP